MLDLFSGSGGASRAALVRGWDVVRIDKDEHAAVTIRADLRLWERVLSADDKFDLIWASPPCTQLSVANQKTRNVQAGLELVRVALEIIERLAPRWWVLENVHGATREISKLIGPPVACYGSFYLWGVFPPFEAKVAKNKTKLSGRRRAERRAAIPWEISNGLVCACETLSLELRARSSPAPSTPQPRPRAHGEQRDLMEHDAAYSAPGVGRSGLPPDIAVGNYLVVHSATAVYVFDSRKPGAPPYETVCEDTNAAMRWIAERGDAYVDFHSWRRETAQSRQLPAPESMHGATDEFGGSDFE